MTYEEQDGVLRGFLPDGTICAEYRMREGQPEIRVIQRSSEDTDWGPWRRPHPATARLIPDVGDWIARRTAPDRKL